MNSSKLPAFWKGLSPKQRRWLLLATPAVLSLVVFLLLPPQPCEKMVTRFGNMQNELVKASFMAKLDSLAFGGHCDTFTLVNDKAFWIVPKCGRASEQFRDSLHLPGELESMKAFVKQAHIGVVHYHYPNMSFEFDQRVRGGYDFRLVYNRNKLQANSPFWSSCEEANQQKLAEYQILLNEHWYVSARRIR